MTLFTLLTWLGADKSLYPHIIPVGKEKTWSFPLLGWENWGSSRRGMVLTFPRPLPTSTRGGNQDFWHPSPSPLVQWEGRIKLLLLPAETHTDPDTARPHLLRAAGEGTVMVDRRGGEERRGALTFPPPPSPCVPTSRCQGNPRPQGRGPPTPRIRRVPSNTPEPASGISPATLPRPWPPPPRPGQDAQAAQPRPLAPNPRHAAWYGSARACPLCHHRRTSSSTSGFARWEEGGVGPGAERPPGAGQRLDITAPTLPRPSTCARRLPGAPGLCLWDWGAPSWRMVQDGGLEQGRREWKGEENESPQNGRGTVERGGGCEEPRTGRRNILSASRILAGHTALPRWFPWQPSGVWWLCLSEGALRERPLHSATSFSGYGSSGHALHCKLSDLPQIYNAQCCHPPLLQTRQTSIVLYFDTEMSLCPFSTHSIRPPLPPYGDYIRAFSQWTGKQTFRKFQGMTPAAQAERVDVKDK